MGSPFQPSVASAVSSLHCRYVMDLLPSAALHDLSGSGASSADESGEPSPPLRLALTVGQSRLLHTLLVLALEIQLAGKDPRSREWRFWSGAVALG